MSMESSAERAHKAIQDRCRNRGYAFYYDMTKEEFMKRTYDCMMTFPGWLIPVCREEDFIKDRNNDTLRSKWAENHCILKVFYDFEGTGEWLFAIEKNNETKDIGA